MGMVRVGLTPLQRVVIFGSLTYAAFFVFMLIFRPLSKADYQTFFNVYQIIPPLIAGLIGLFFSRRGHLSSRSERLGWAFIGLGCLSFAGGQSTWTYYESVRGIEVPFPGWADLGYLGAYPLILVGITILLRSMFLVGRARVMLDSAIAASSFGVLSWYFLVEETWKGSDLALLGKLISVAYPLGGILALFGAIVLFNSASSSQSRRSLALVGSGIILLIFADSCFTYYSLQEAYETGSWSDWGWSFGWMLIGFGPLSHMWWPEAQGSPERRRVSRFAGVLAHQFRLFAPYLAVLCAMSAVVVHDYLQDGRIKATVYAEALGLFLLVMLRQVFMLLENGRLTKQMVYLNENLEQIVSRRTEQLQALQELTKAVNSTLSESEVVSEACQHVPKAIECDALALWIFGDGNVLDQDQWEFSLHRVEDCDENVERFLRQLEPSERTEIVSLPYEPDPQHQGAHGSCVRAPLRWHHRQVGVVGLIRSDGGFDSSEAELLESVGIELGTALENSRQYSAALAAADRDPVTNLLNHRAVHQRLREVFDEATQRETPLSLVMMDLNNFKLFNDTYGHPTGDQVLKQVAAVLKEECSEDSYVARYGGDEFIIVMPGQDTEEATALAQRIRERMSEHGFTRSDHEFKIPVSLSFGIAGYPFDGDNVHEVLTIADTNLYTAKGSDEGIARTSEQQRSNRELRAESSFAVLDALVTAVDNKDRYTRKHSEDVTEYALWIAEELGLSEETMRVVRIAGLLHDVGKIGVPDEILRKPDRLTPEEYEVMKRHPRLGELIVGGVPGMESILDGVRSHHERWDGQGYPDALGGKDIPLLGRLLAVADAFSAMTTDRPYRKGLDWDTAMTEIRSNIGTQFDPEMAKAFLQAAARRKALFEEAHAVPKAA
ncbi:MAG TPA: diguanylate cyclase [Fimbriimonadaceae bacterium]|nr:diguanylate cyclase [Fimbriimonadaceae bacterium]